MIDIFDAARAARTPTLFGATTLLREDTSLVTDRRVRTLYPPWKYAGLQATARTARDTDQTVARENLARQVAQVAAMLRGGGVVITGTDSPIANRAVSTHLNLRAMVKYPVSPYDALTTATRAPGEFLGEPLGTVRPGTYADLVVLGGDPLADITAAADVRQVMCNGELFDVDGLLAPFVSGAAGERLRARSRPVSRLADPVPDPPANRRYWWHDPHYVEESRHTCCQES
ncbi:Amidohydrolase family protein [Actinopolymorpha cephalotaxi]|uniref:Amidohydrolase family protein n=1 Tax=Actinopolymorpha cephalotaxi TaxID=504797 RepID=A0A1I2YIR9_9ACTN|nr:amidohydrolase family protein [Actinopolymorpha cephalotaxi]NYH86949.1 hypothetical protein [Actinopolymorpha cephalotaxi]SFH25488.1 Amidohydrolase family protein [Actinopolymorpha cephalotaxi]